MNKTKLALLSLTSLAILLISCNSKENGTATLANIDSLNKQIQNLSDNQKQIDANKKNSCRLLSGIVWRQRGKCN